jgi:hypothetical protein
MALALCDIRRRIVSSGLLVCASSAEHEYYCPDCGKALTGWGTYIRTVVTSSGEGRLPSRRYRCRDCKVDHRPWEMQNGLDEGNQYTMSARQMIAEEAADAAYERSSRRLARMGIPVSASEVDQIGQEVGLWRKQEEEAVRASHCKNGHILQLPLYDWDRWPTEPASTDIVTFSVDGGMVRSDQVGPKGLEWFEVRSGIIRFSSGDADRNKKAQTIRLGGVMDPDRLFEKLRAQWWQAPASWRRKDGGRKDGGRKDGGRKDAQQPRLVFIADGAEWIWLRAGWYIPQATQVLDIYHAAQHVGSAAKAAWGQESALAKHWADIALPWLMEVGGPTSIIKALVNKLRCATANNQEELITQLRYLWRHRHRMHYAQWREEGLPIGSGVIESTIKQLSTRRLCQSGMMWTKQHADLMLHLRAACLSDSLQLTVDRERRIRVNRALRYKREHRGFAKAI